MSLYYKASDVPVGTMDMGNTSFTTKMVYGLESSFMVAERPAGYHSRPHVHDCEQLNYMQEGSLIIYFADGRAFHLEAGDVLRIPRNVIHWSWNKSDHPCLLLEVHTPGLQDDPMNTGYAKGLLDEDEEMQSEGPSNIFCEPDEVDVTAIENGDADR